MSCVEKLTNIQEKNKSMICLGLDLDPKRMPAEFTKSNKSMYEYAMEIIEATKDFVCAYKPNMAFYENRGPDGLSLLRSINARIPDDIPIIVDGKRGDIGNTASHYAEALFDIYRADWVTLNPYMGYDTIRPFLEYKDKGVFILCLTSNTGSKDFQHLDVNGKPLYQIVAEKVDYWNKEDNCGLVVGATQPEELKEVRKISGSMPLLIPGVGAQGGSLEKAVIYGTDNFSKPAVINVSRSVLYASTGPDFAERAREELKKLNSTVAKIRSGEITLDALAQQEVEKPSEFEKATTSVVVHEMPKPKVDPPFEPKPEYKSEPTPESKPEPAPEAKPEPNQEMEVPQHETQPNAPQETLRETQETTPTNQPEIVLQSEQKSEPETVEERPEEPKVEQQSFEQKTEIVDDSTDKIEDDSPDETPQPIKPPEPLKPPQFIKPPEPLKPPTPLPPIQRDKPAEETNKTEEKAEDRPKPTMPKPPPPPLPKPPPVLPPRPDLMNKRREERRNDDRNQHNRPHDNQNRDHQNRNNQNNNFRNDRDHNRNNNDQNRDQRNDNR